MSRKRDQERLEAMKARDPNYVGFRGHEKEPTKPGSVRLVAVTCSVCQRKRNVPEGIALSAGDAYVCSSCEEEEAAKAAAGGAEKASD
ncbi:MAG: hypothetical protein EXR47_08550 [Dehalococcoidia bacterium]|nr:hypothetical protein [Dehalococcoidia bacterium]